MEAVERVVIQLIGETGFLINSVHYSRTPIFFEGIDQKLLLQSRLFLFFIFIY